MGLGFSKGDGLQDWCGDSDGAMAILRIFARSVGKDMSAKGL